MSFFNELKRRNVFKVGVAYLITSWLLIQVADILLDNIGAPPWVLQAIFVVLGVGLFISLLVAWAFELTPEGIKREKDVDRNQSITPHTGRTLNIIIITLLVVGMAYFFWESRFSKPDTGLEQSPVTSDNMSQPLAEDASAPPEPVISRQSIAVLPFDNRSRSEDDAFFVDGVHDDLLTQLTKVHALRVISRTSVENYRDSEKPLPVIAAELGVGMVMEGSVQRAGDRIRINVQLIDAATDEHLWAEIYDRELTAANIFDIQSEIATAIASALRAELTEDDAQRLAIKPTQNLAAYEAYLLGRQRFAKRSGTGLAEAQGYFQQAIDLDPDFGLAYVSLADVYQVQGDWGLITLEEANAKSLPLAEKALQLDDRSGEAYTTLASIREYSGDLEGADQAYRHALDLAPNYAQASFWYGLSLLSSMGLPSEAVPRFEHALSLDPLSGIVLVNLASAFMALGDFEAARVLNQKALEIDPFFVQALSAVGAFAWTVNGDLVAALDHSLLALAVDPDEQWAFTNVVELFSELGDDATAVCVMGTIRDALQDSPAVNVQNALLAIYTGNAGAAELPARNALDNIYVQFNKSMPLAIVQAQLQHDGQLAEALALYQEHFPELLETPLREFSLNNSKAAIDLASLLQAMGRQDEAQQLLDGSEKYIQGSPRLGGWGYWIDDVRIQVLRGENEKALAALRAAVDTGWRIYWRYYLEHDPILEPLRSDPRFQGMVQEIRADMAEQLARVRSSPQTFEICTG